MLINALCFIMCPCELYKLTGLQFRCKMRFHLHREWCQGIRGKPDGTRCA